MRKTEVLSGIEISIAVVLLAFSIPLFATPEVQNIFVNSMQIIGGIAGIITMLLALQLYKKFGIEPMLLQKQFESVNNLIALLKNKRISAKKNINSAFILRLQICAPWTEGFAESMFRETEDVQENYGDLPLAFGESYREGMTEIITCLEDMYLPNHIREKLQAFNFFGSWMRKNQQDVCLLVDLDNFQAKQTGLKDYHFLIGKKINEKTTFRDYLSLCRELEEAIQSWMIEHSSIPIS